jgi:hypothetical protein
VGYLLFVKFQCHSLQFFFCLFYRPTILYTEKSVVAQTRTHRFLSNLSAPCIGPTLDTCSKEPHRPTHTTKNSACASPMYQLQDQTKNRAHASFAESRTPWVSNRTNLTKHASGTSRPLLSPDVVDDAPHVFSFLWPLITKGSIYAM